MTLAWFCGGMALAVLSVDCSASWRRLVSGAADRPFTLWAVALALYVVATVLTSENNEHAGVWLFVTYSVIAFLVLAPLVFRRSTGSRVDPIMLWRPLGWIGIISYGMYLYHYPLMSEISTHVALSGASLTVRMVFLVLVTTAASVRCAALCYYILERPVLRFKRVNDYPWVGSLLRMGDERTAPAVGVPAEENAAG